ncbi:MAG: isopentenyl-diphosphate delta-isomerase [Saprospiraceae bacterium]|nr:isopentenyl-diphosphate delta-isomerase [Saprospiraceae bacterium]
MDEQEKQITQRKTDHIELAFESQVKDAARDPRFYYEPMLTAFPEEIDLGREFLGRTLRYPIWVSSMTGGTEHARTINTNLARMCGEFGLGMGLGSCRVLLEDDTRFEDFNMRPIMGPDVPLFANLGIAQVEELVADKSLARISELVDSLQADGIIIHVNPLQEWLQPEGDAIMVPPIETIQAVLDTLDTRVIVKEVGQGMGPASLSELLRLPIDAIELAAHGGTNFAMLELLRADDHAREVYAPLARIGHSPDEMIHFINEAVKDLGSSLQCRQVIISGGLRGFLDGYYYMNRLTLPSVYGHASQFLKYAQEDYATLSQFARSQTEGLKLAHAYLKVR